MEGKLGQTLMLYKVPGLPYERVVLAGMGAADKLDALKYRKAVHAATRAVIATGVKEAFNLLTLDAPSPLTPDMATRHAVEATEDALYIFDQCKSGKNKPKPPALNKVTFVVAEAGQVRKAKAGTAQGQAIARGVSLAKDLGNLPGNICTPTFLAEQARKMARGNDKLKTTVLSEAQMEKLGMGSLLSVSRGSRQPAKLIIMEYNGAAKTSKPYALVGKGITFDAGGISLKPAPAMDEMKWDMGGAASVFGTMAAVIEMGLKINVVGVVASAENLPDGNASKPGDIVTSMSGQTIEVLNTDAEGRLVLCDALTYTQRYKPRTVIDIATLTGACVIALGSHASGLLTSDEELADELLMAGNTAADRAWRLPLWEDYQDQLKSNFADFANVGGREAGTITAACFLSRFTDKFRWAHLDIAGTAWNTGNEKGGTGRPVGLLAQYLIDRTSR
jgi:leucyl aminopeptidase